MAYLVIDLRNPGIHLRTQNVILPPWSAEVYKQKIQVLHSKSSRYNQRTVKPGKVQIFNLKNTLSLDLRSNLFKQYAKLYLQHSEHFIKSQASTHPQDKGKATAPQMSGVALTCYCTTGIALTCHCTFSTAPSQAPGIHSNFPHVIQTLQRFLLKFERSHVVQL